MVEKEEKNTEKSEVTFEEGIMTPLKEKDDGKIG